MAFISKNPVGFSAAAVDFLRRNEMAVKSESN